VTCPHYDKAKKLFNSHYSTISHSFYRFCYYVNISYFTLYFSEMSTSDTAELDEVLILDTETPTAIHTDGTNIDKTGKVFVYFYKYLVTFGFIN